MNLAEAEPQWTLHSGMCNNDSMMKEFSTRTCTAVILLLLLLAQGCAVFTGSLDKAMQYSRESRHSEAVGQLDSVIKSNASESDKAQAFLLRAKKYKALREYRYAYRDLQVAWKLSCYLYQTETTPTAPGSEPFNSAQACTEHIPLLIDDLKPFVSDFSAIMATQEASALVKQLFPELPR
ncbi:hypothetical protein [Maridesulfovibrio sp. FT414]|uniref:hypothetical protein n=1 Tax=Maridesulfovibrio sp. FT414 TaxID=2979469 RepID=UPI003D800C08